MEQQWNEQSESMPEEDKTAEQQLETETGKDFAKTGDSPPTYAETDKPLAQGAEAMLWPDYDKLNVDEVLARAHTEGIDATARANLITYERAHKNRDGVIKPLVNWNS